jgi:hypothetical protein
MQAVKIKNFWSYVWFVFWPTIIILFIDVFFLSFSIYQSIYQLFCENSIYQILYEKSVVAIISYVLAIIAIIWQFRNVLVTYLKPLVKREKRGCPLNSLIENGGNKKDFKNFIKINHELTQGAYSYTRDDEEGILENEKISEILTKNEKTIRLKLVNDRRKKTQHYIDQYRDILLKFLNHKWYDVKQNGGKFTNDKKICFVSELYDDNGELYWKIIKGCYYNTYLTNVIFTKFIGGSEYSLYPPFNSTNTVVGHLGDSIFSDHIGVATILYTSDNHFIDCQQKGKAVQYANKYMPSGSGSLDFKDYHEGDDLCTVVVRGVERELFEETSLGKSFTKKKRQKLGIEITTSVLCYYRDLERAGKPEFCCISKINKPKGYIVDKVLPQAKELADIKWAQFNPEKDNSELESEILPTASLSLKMNYKALREFLKREVK